MLGFNGGTIGIANTVFTGTKSDDPNYSNVSLLLNGNGTNGSTTFTDSSSNNHTITANGNAQISTAQSKFGGASMYFDGSGDYLTIADDTSFHVGSGDFTIEFWIYRSTAVDMNIINKRTSSAASVQWLYFQINASGVLRLWATSDNSNWDIANSFNFGNTALSTGQWYHIALVRNVQEFATYVNGTKSSNTFTSSASITTGGTNTVQIGGDPAFNGGYVNGYIDDFRITKGVARYTSNFTSPTAQLPGGETGPFASGLWTSSDHIKQIRNELWPGANIYAYTLGGLSGKFFNGDWRSTISTGNIGTLPLTTTNESSNVTGSGGMPSADHRYGINLWDYITYTTIGDSYGFIAIGYFKPPTTGTYTFYTSSDDYSGVWIGPAALPGATRTSSNAVVNNGLGGSSGQANTKLSGTISLTANTYYPIRIVHEESAVADNLTFSWAGPSISETTDLTQYFYSISLGGTLTGNYYGL